VFKVCHKLHSCNLLRGWPSDGDPKVNNANYIYVTICSNVVIYTELELYLIPVVMYSL